MNAKELRALSKQVIEGYHLDVDNYIAAERLANHILSTVKEDDDEPITEDFCDSVLDFKFDDSPVSHAKTWVSEGNLLRITIYACVGGWENQAYVHLYKSGQKVKIVKTRGELRRLIKELGVNE